MNLPAGVLHSRCSEEIEGHHRVDLEASSGLYFLGPSVELKQKQGTCNASLPDSIAMGTVTILCAVRQARPVTGITNKEEGKDLGQL